MAARQPQWATAAAAKWMEGQLHDCDVQRRNCGGRQWRQWAMAPPRQRRPCGHVPLVRLVVASPHLMLPPPICRCLSLSSLLCGLSSLLCGLSSCCAVASCSASLGPLLWLVVVSPLLTPPPPICGRLHLSLHHRLLSYTSLCHCLLGLLSGWLFLRVPLPLIALSPLIIPLSVPYLPLGPLVRLVLHRPSSCRCLPSASISASHCTIASCHAIASRASLALPACNNSLIRPLRRPSGGVGIGGVGHMLKRLADMPGQIANPPMPPPLFWLLHSSIRA
jgi:hypothetical protein